MPLFYQHNINGDERLGVWKIEEDEDFFLSKVPPNLEITHEHKRLQHLAGRYLLQQLFPDFPYELIQIADTRKPFLFNEAYHFSISHCNNFAAALVSRSHRVGVDIEVVTATIEKISHKFLNDFEVAILGEQGVHDRRIMEKFPVEIREKIILHGAGTNGDHSKTNSFSDTSKSISEIPRLQPNNEVTDYLALLTLCWSAKEAMYKWYGKGAVDFKNHMQLTKLYRSPVDGWVETDFLFRKEKPEPLLLRSRFIGDAVLTYVIS